MADEKPKEDAKKSEPAAKGGGGIKAMLPLILTVVLMPALAFVMTKFVMVPKLQKAITASATTLDPAAAAAAEGDAKAGEAKAEESGKSAGEGKEGKGEAKPIPKGARATWTLPKVIVNVAGTQATRYLMSTFTLVGKGEEFKQLLEANVDQVRDVAAGVLSIKTIQDLEKPDARSIIKSELMSAINTALGKPAVQEIYITEFAIQ